MIGRFANKLFPFKTFRMWLDSIQIWFNRVQRIDLNLSQSFFNRDLSDLYDILFQDLIEIRCRYESILAISLMNRRWPDDNWASKFVMLPNQVPYRYILNIIFR